MIQAAPHVASSEHNRTDGSTSRPSANAFTFGELFDRPTAYQVAQACAQTGWRVFPLRRNTKRPALKDWPNQATTDLEVLEEWWCGQYAGCLTGVATGERSGIWVLDVDAKAHNGYASLRQLLTAHDLPFERPAGAFAVKTPSGGEHWYLGYPPDRKIKNSVSHVGLGLDVRGERGLVVAPGTWIGDGHYRPLNWTIKLPLPRAWPWLEELASMKPRPERSGVAICSTDLARRSLDAQTDQLAAMGRGSGRNDALNRTAFGLGQLHHVLDRAEAERALLDACRANGLLDEDGEAACLATFDSGWTAGSTQGDETP